MRIAARSTEAVRSDAVNSDVDQRFLIRLVVAEVHTATALSVENFVHGILSSEYNSIVRNITGFAKPELATAPAHGRAGGQVIPN